MRAVSLCVVLVAAAGCGPKANPKDPVVLDEDLGPRAKAAATAPAIEAARPEAPIGKGVRSGTISRAHLVAVLDGGPAAFLRQLEVTPRLTGDRFVGWQLVQLLDHDSALVGVDVAPGDVLLAVNGKPIARPDQLQAVWDSLRTADELVADLWRGDGKLQLKFAIDPPVGAR